MSNYYHLCNQYMGKMVEIRCHDGRVHRGRIVRVSPSHVYLMPVGRGIAGKATSKVVGKHAEGTKSFVKGNEILFFAPYAVPLAAIAGIGLIGAAAAFSPFFWW